MKIIEQPKARLIMRPQLDAVEIYNYLQEVGGLKWYYRVFPNGEDISINDAEALVEFCGRLCYRSWAEGLNPNVSKVREDSAKYLLNILGSGHGSVLEHASFTFICQDVSRVFTHEQVRHRAGTAFSQESMRYVRLDDIPFWFPKWALEDQELADKSIDLLYQMEAHQKWMAKHFHLDDEGVPFSEKKAKTSFMRRFAPDGVATSIVVTANIRSIRHMLTMRTDVAAEEEIRLVYEIIGNKMIEECPLLFGDYAITENGQFITDHRKV